MGGKIEEGESLEEAALREVFEETGIRPEELKLGPVVWHGEFDLILSGRLQRLNQKFLVANTTQTTISYTNFTETEKKVIKKIAWFSLDDIKSCKQIIFPIVLPLYLPDILAGNYPKEPIEIDLSKQPS